MPETANKYRQYYYAEMNRYYPETGVSAYKKKPYERNLTLYENERIHRNKSEHLKANKKVLKRNAFLQKVVTAVFFAFVAGFALPLGINKVALSAFHGSKYPSVKADYYKLRFPTAGYLNNDLLFNKKYLSPHATKKAQMVKMSETNELNGLKNEIKYIMSLYPSIEPSVYIWQYDTENFVDIEATKTYSAASIIKVPVLIELFRLIERGEISLTDKMTLTQYYRAEGSGSLQYKAENSQWTIDKLARMMITESDNSATNMLMSKMGSMTDVNSAIRQWGLSGTQVRTWLPDMTGNNYTTAKDIATMLYNIDNNPKFLDITSKEKIFDYMGHVHNNRLIHAGLGDGAVFMHKTGDIGKMLGDAGIVFTPNGKKYIIVILANRPHNSILGKEFIVKTSETVYNYMVR